MRTAIYSEIDPHGISLSNQDRSTDDWESEQDILADREFINQFQQDRYRGIIDPYKMDGYKQPDFVPEVPDLYAQLMSETVGQDETDFNLALYGQEVFVNKFLDGTLPMSEFQAHRILKEAISDVERSQPDLKYLVDDRDSTMDPYLKIAMLQAFDRDTSPGSSLFDETGKISKTGELAIMSGNKAFAAENALFKTQGRLQIESARRSNVGEKPGQTVESRIVDEAPPIYETEASKQRAKEANAQAKADITTSEEIGYQAPPQSTVDGTQTKAKYKGYKKTKKGMPWWEDFWYNIHGYKKAQGDKNKTRWP